MEFKQWYASLSKKERKSFDDLQELLEEQYDGHDIIGFRD